MYINIKQTRRMMLVRGLWRELENRLGLIVDDLLVISMEETWVRTIEGFRYLLD